MAVGAYAVYAYPDIHKDVLDLLPKDAATETKLAAVKESRAKWLSSVQNLAQTFA